MSIYDRTLELCVIAPEGVSEHHFSGSEAFVDERVGSLLQDAIAQGDGYTIEEESMSVVAAVPEQSEGRGLTLCALPAEWTPLNAQILGLVRPPIPDYVARRIADTLDMAGIKTCGDVIDGGLLGLSRTGLFVGELEVVTGLVKAITGRPIPLGNEGTTRKPV